MSCAFFFFFLSGMIIKTPGFFLTWFCFCISYIQKRRKGEKGKRGDIFDNQNFPVAGNRGRGLFNLGSRSHRSNKNSESINALHTKFFFHQYWFFKSYFVYFEKSRAILMDGVESLSISMRLIIFFEPIQTGLPKKNRWTLTS